VCVFGARPFFYGERFLYRIFEIRTDFHALLYFGEPRKMYPSFPMHEMSKWEFILNNPEWVSVFASAVFALVTAYIIWRQKVVMEQQVEVTNKLGEISARHERLQNRLLKLQHEHEWLTAMNMKREAILKTATKLHIDMLYIMANHRLGRDHEMWSSLLAMRSELKLQLEILDTAAYSTLKTGWYAQLLAWADALFAIIPARKPWVRRRRKCSPSHSLSAASRCADSMCMCSCSSGTRRSADMLTKSAGQNICTKWSPSLVRATLRIPRIPIF
jgi:hypothetical protein